jgi:hypothetical protein
MGAMAYCYRGEQNKKACAGQPGWSTETRSCTPCTHLRQVVLNDNVVGELEQTSRVAVQVLPLLLAQTVEVELTNLSVLAVGTLVPPVRFSRDDVVGDLVRSLDGGHSSEPGGGLGGRHVLVVRVGEVHGLATRVGLECSVNEISNESNAVDIPLLLTSILMLPI